MPGEARKEASLRPARRRERRARRDGARPKAGRPRVPKALRAAAEEAVRRRPPAATEGIGDMMRLVHELQVHQVELDMQNDELVRAQSQLEEALGRYFDLYDASPMAYVTLEAGVITAANIRAGELLGERKGALGGRSMRGFVDPEFRELMRIHLDEVAADGHGTVELRVKRRDGRRLDVFAESTMVAAPGRSKEVRMGLTDITALKRAEESLTVSERSLRLVLASSPVGIAAVDADGTVSFCNAPFGSIFQIDERSMVGRNLRVLVRNPDVAAALRHGLVGSRARYEGPLVAAGHSDGSGDGAPVVHIEINPILGEGGSPTGAVLVAKDITEEVRFRAELELAKERSERDERLMELGRMAGGIAHELRNPLAAMKNAAYFLEHSADLSEPDASEMLSVFNREIASSESIIASLLSLVRTPQAPLEEVDVSAVIQGLLDALHPPAGVIVKTRLEEGLPRVLADPAQLGIVFRNLLQNAVEALQGGGRLLITAGRSDGWVSVSVSDTGDGIPPELLGRLFEPLMSTKRGGTGLGLAIAKALVESHGGTIEATSEPGRGSVFTVRLRPADRAG